MFTQTPAQEARERYEQKFIKLTLRLERNLKPQIDLLINKFGSINEAITRLISLDYDSNLNSDSSKTIIDSLTSENIELKSKIEKLEAQLTKLKRSNPAIEDREELLEKIMQDWESRRAGINLSPIIDATIEDSENAQFEIL